MVFSNYWNLYNECVLRLQSLNEMEMQSLPDRPQLRFYLCAGRLHPNKPVNSNLSFHTYTFQKINVGGILTGTFLTKAGLNNLSIRCFQLGLNWKKGAATAVESHISTIKSSHMALAN